MDILFLMMRLGSSSLTSDVDPRLKDIDIRDQICPQHLNEQDTGSYMYALKQIAGICCCVACSVLLCDPAMLILSVQLYQASLHTTIPKTLQL
jgi:hypothetical protein